MGYRLKRNEGVEAGLRRIAREQIEKSLRDLSDSEVKTSRKVHQIRKRCKKLRAVIRLVRPALGDAYGRENREFRDAARMLSQARDAKTALDTYDAVMETFEDQVQRKAFGSIRRELTNRRKALLDERVDLNARFQEVAARLEAARDRIPSWRLSEEGFSAIRGGLKKTYSRACKEMDGVAEEPADENFHNWRKRVKYHRYHCQILTPLWPAELRARAGEADRLGDYLGDDHDLAVLRAQVVESPEAFGQERDIQAFLGLMDQQRELLQQKSFLVGRRLFAEKPGALCNRMSRYWDVWQL
ncbi:CHAD domain-containing protein [Rubinisphaera margarita]|uniref:CHAD domain-containing protein n=1 Tax=Rubinisphaera margarita TaxID=2909586 RepID=UPI001EE92070|nr:CHAD domain-containing protein [Rubinisphaera margarita]MCG6156459.1 CHAD domain-containing protein [Rubinisphaera margarita]